MKKFLSLLILCLIGAPAVFASLDGPVFLSSRAYRAAPYLNQVDIVDSLGFGINPVSISEDSAYMVAGAPGTDSTNTCDGAAWVLTKCDHGMGWTPTQKLTPSVAINDYAWFGFSTAISDDGSYIVVGAPLEEIGGDAAAGAAYVYLLSTTWAQQQRIEAPTTAAGDHFGCSVAISGDGDRLASGMRLYDGTETDQGGVAVFSRSGTTWTIEQTLVASDAAANDELGNSVSLSSAGDVLVTGAHGHGTVGAAYVFTRSGTTWTQAQKLEPDDGTAGDEFGFPVKVSPDGTRILVAALQQDGAKGAVYVFDDVSGTWTQTGKIVPTDVAADDLFGFSLGISNANTTVLATSPGATSDTGAAYLYALSAGSWALSSKKTSPSKHTEAGDQFAHSAVLSYDGYYAALGTPGDNDIRGTVFSIHLGTETIALELLNALRNVLNDPSQFQWSDAELVKFLSDGVLDVVARTQSMQHTETVTLEPNKLNYSVTSRYISMISAIYNGAKGLVRGVPQAIGHQFAEVGEPNAFFLWDGELWVYPPPTVTGSTVTLYGITKPYPFTCSAGFVDGQTYYHKAIIHYAAAQAFYSIGKYNNSRQLMEWYFDATERLRAQYHVIPKEPESVSK